METYRIGIDLGGTNIAAGLVNEAGSIVDNLSVKTNVPRPMEAIVDDMARLVTTLTERNGLTPEQIVSVGVGVPCTVNEENGHMEDANNLGFDDVPLRELLEARLGRSVFLGNDANVAAWGEYKTGSYGGSFLMVTIGTGIGGGIILNNRLWTGVNYAAGEFGHMVIRQDGPLCTCGRRGCFEALGSAAGLISQAREAMYHDKESLLWQLCGGNPELVEAKTVFDAAAAGDKTGLKLLDGYTTILSEGLTNLINIFQPAYLCIGGGVSKAGDALLVPLKEKIRSRLYSKNAKKNTQIVLARLNNDAGILGAALLEK